MVVAVAAPVAVVVAVPSKSEIHNGVHSISTTRDDVALTLRARGASLHVQPSRCAPNARPDIGIPPKRRSLYSEYVPPGRRTTRTGGRDRGGGLSDVCGGSILVLRVYYDVYYSR